MFESSFLENIIVNAPLGIVTTDLAGRITLINRLACRVHRQGEPSHIVRKHISHIAGDHPEDLMLAFHSIVNREKEKTTVEYKIAKTDCEAFIRSTMTMLRDENYSPVGVLIMCEDVTEQRTLRDTLEREKKFSESIIETANLLIVGIAPDGKIILFNQAAEELTGYSRKEVLGKDWFELLAPEDERADIIQIFYSIIDGKTPAYHEHSIITRNGGRRLVGWHETLLPDLGERSEGVIAIGEDITEKRKLEEDLINERQRLEAILTSLGAGLLLINRDYVITYANALVERDFGPSVGKKCFCAIHGTLAAASPAGLCRDCPAKEIFEKGAKNATTEIKGKDINGADFWIQLITTPVLNEHREVIGVLELIVPINERKRLEDQLIQAQKMEAVGVLAGGIAHDFNNVLGAILGYSSLIKSRVTAEDKSFKYADMIETASRHATALAERLLTFSRRSTREYEEVDINDLIKNTVMLMRSSLKAQIKIKAGFGKNVPLVFGDRTQLEQLIMNIVINARDAMPNGGTISIETESRHLDDKFCKSNLGAQLGENAVITISDTGTGMSEEIRRRIFEPFFTTKKEGKGTGLGLSIAYSVVRGHKGFIDVKSRESKGTAFIIYLPASKQKAESIPYYKDPAEVQKTILVVDKEDSARIQVKDALTKLGYNVVIASAGNEAVSMLEKSFEEINLAIIGTLTSDMNAKQTLNELRRINPQLRAILSSQNPANQKASSAKKSALSSFVFIEKPFNIDKLATMVHEILVS